MTTPDTEALVEKVAREIVREQFRKSCTRAMLDDMVALPLRDRDVRSAKAAIRAVLAHYGEVGNWSEEAELSALETLEQANEVWAKWDIRRALAAAARAEGER